MNYMSWAQYKVGASRRNFGAHGVENHVVSQETMDFLSLFFGEDVSLFYNTPNFKSYKIFF